MSHGKIVESLPGTTIIMEQIFNAGNLILLALEQLKNISIPQSGKDDSFARSAFFAKLHEIERILSRCTEQLLDAEPQSVFPYTVFDSSAFANAPEDLVLEFFIQSGRLCANVYLIAPAYHQSPTSHHRQKSISSAIGATMGGNDLLGGSATNTTTTINNNPSTTNTSAAAATTAATANAPTSLSTAAATAIQQQQQQQQPPPPQVQPQPQLASATTVASSTYFFYNGAPVEVTYCRRLEALLPSILTAMSSVEASRGLLEDLCEKIEFVQGMK